MAFPTRLANLSTREAIADAVYRVVAAYDENDVTLLESALTTDVVFEAAGQVMNGIQEVKTKNYNYVSANLDTTHFVTNMRVNVASDSATTATATCNTLAQHYPLDTIAGADRRLLAGTRYVLDLVKDEKAGVWKIKKWVLKIVWAEGDFSVVTPNA